MSKHNEYLYETDGAARAEYSAVMEAREQAKESEETAELKKRIADLVAEHVVDEILKDERIAELQQCLLEYVNATERLWTESDELEVLEEKATILLAKGNAL
jgi:hypothetical protein